MKKSMIYRVLIYIAGLLILAMENRTGDCGLYSQKCRIYEELF